MTIEQAINETDALKPNVYDDNQKVVWLNNLDRRIWTDVYMTHEACNTACFTGYDEDTDQCTVLLVPDPYAYDIYVNFLSAQIDKANGEMEKYNQNVSFYNAAFGDFSKAYNRTHKPLHSHPNRFRF